MTSAELFILASCCGSPMRRNSVLEELRVRRLAVAENAEADQCWSQKQMDRKKRRVVCHRHKGDGSRKVMK